MGASMLIMYLGKEASGASIAPSGPVTWMIRRQRGVWKGLCLL